MLTRAAPIRPGGDFIDRALVLPYRSKFVPASDMTDESNTFEEIPGFIDQIKEHRSGGTLFNFSCKVAVAKVSNETDGATVVRLLTKTSRSQNT